MLVVAILCTTIVSLSTPERHVAQSLVKEMFNHAFDNYMTHAFPMDELAPLSCNGTDTLGGYALTLLDTLDTFIVLNNFTQFRKVTSLFKTPFIL